MADGLWLKMKNGSGNSGNQRCRSRLIYWELDVLEFLDILEKVSFQRIQNIQCIQSFAVI